MDGIVCPSKWNYLLSDSVVRFLQMPSSFLCCLRTSYFLGSYMYADSASEYNWCCKRLLIDPKIDARYDIETNCVYHCVCYPLPYVRPTLCAYTYTHTVCLSNR